MTTRTIDRDSTGQFTQTSGDTGHMHIFEVRSLEIEHRYHDDEPVHNAFFRIVWPNGYERVGFLNEFGKAVVIGVPLGAATVRFGPDARNYEVVAQRANPSFQEELSAADVDALISKYSP